MLWIALQFPNFLIDAVNRCSGTGGVGGVGSMGGHELMRDLLIIVTDVPAARQLLHAINAGARNC
jgi:hypothetical protein